jgi:hypothetical protein
MHRVFTRSFQNTLRFYLLICLIVSSLGISCKKALEELTTFTIQTEADFTVPGTLGIQTPLSIPTPDVPTRSSQEFARHRTNYNLVKEVRLDNLKLSITRPSGQTFRFLKSVRLFIEAAGLPKQEVAFRTNIDNAVGSTLDLETVPVNLKEYIRQDTFTLHSEVVTDEVILQDIDIHADANFRVKAGIQ